jgi:hypothetical protein
MANAQLAKASEKAMQAAILHDNMTALEKEWADYWK